MELKVIARIRNGFKEKFGIPRQSGLADIVSQIEFEKEFRDRNAVRALEGFSHIWLIWGFSANAHRQDEAFRPTVRPPRLGGNERVGVFATRSPFRPNPIGLSCVKLKQVIDGPDGPVLEVLGADLMDGTPVYDIKPYLAQFDSHPDAKCGFAEPDGFRTLEVHIDDSILEKIPRQTREALMQALTQDPRPQYQNDPDRTYGMKFADLDVHFKVCGKELTVLDVTQTSRE
ncbi:MAG: tRNA (N6-threonylcarbamoyladenosine(37)-N6)-methyltransferase TrmO [Spirochaetales bacterium]|nr:tRNA (N6-threonylcarbamoyladenosine(37)-N6)-methyltransferase TrmO [Spirochaetales bacterium]